MFFKSQLFGGFWSRDIKNWLRRVKRSDIRGKSNFYLRFSYRRFYICVVGNAPQVKSVYVVLVYAAQARHLKLFPNKGQVIEGTCWPFLHFFATCLAAAGRLILVCFVTHNLNLLNWTCGQSIAFFLAVLTCLSEMCWSLMVAWFALSEALMPHTRGGEYGHLYYFGFCKDCCHTPGE